MNSVLSCFFPTTLVIVDDNTVFLNSLKDIIKLSDVSLKCFLDPVEALDFINETARTNSLSFSDLVASGEETSSDWQSILLNVHNVHRQIYFDERFSKISAVLVDYAMPKMDGVELCRRIEDPSIQKILLTGAADERIAVDAFNNRSINRFLKKSAPSLAEDLIDSVTKSIYQYFSIYTSDLINHLSTKDHSHLKDPIFANFFFNTCLNRSYVEYYMLDAFGSYVFLKEDGQASFLCVLTEDEMNRITEVGIDSGEISDEVLTGLQSREYMLVFHDRRGGMPPIGTWDRYLRPARKLDGYQTYYFSFAEDGLLDLDFDKIKSFKQFKIKNENLE